MAFEISESLPLSRFIWNSNWVPLLGGSVYPLRYFGSDRSNDPNDYLEVILVVNCGDRDVAITRGGGFYCRDYSSDTTRKKMDVSGRSLNSEISECFNSVLCELAIYGLPSMPFTIQDVHPAKLIGKHASVVGGGGSNMARTVEPFFLLASGLNIISERFSSRKSTIWAPNFFWHTTNPATLDEIHELNNSRILGRISKFLPALIVSTNYHISVRNVAEAVIGSWMISEQIISHLWLARVSEINDSLRRKRLKDHRTYSMAVKCEILLEVGIIDEIGYKSLGDARKARNDLAHGAIVEDDNVEITFAAMIYCLDLLGISTDRFRRPTRTGYGALMPSTVMSPEFDFN